MKSLRRLVPALLPVLLLLPACASAGKDESERSVAWLVRHGRYDEAVELAARDAEQNPQDEQAREAHRLASTAWLLERGRRLAFEGRNQEALDAFREAERISPDSEVVADWLGATRERLADQWFERGLTAHNAEDFEQAIAAYETVLSLQPDHELARETLARALLQQNYRQGMGKEYYDGGVRALDRYFLHEARSLFTYVLKYDSENDRATRRGEQARELLAAERAAMAAEFEDQGEYAASRNEYRLALLLDPDLGPAADGLERMQREEGVAELLREAERLFLKARFEEAEERLDEAAVLTHRQGPEIEEYRSKLVEARLEGLYDAARTLESDWRYVEAVAAYGRLLEREPFYRDAIARRDTLQSYVEQADEIYAAYQKAESDEERLGFLRQIAVFWPEYRDVRLKLAELESEQP